MDFSRRLDLDDVATATVSGTTVFRSNKAQYSVGDRIISGDVADIYGAVMHRDDGSTEDVVVKISRDRQDNDLLENEANALAHIRPDHESGKHHRRYFVKLLDTFKVGDKHVNVLRHLGNGKYHSFTAIRAANPNGVQFEHGVWMLNRVLEGLDFLHHSKSTVHGALTPDHIMVYSPSTHNPADPNNHGAKLIGFGASTRIDGQVRVISSNWRALYPPEVTSRLRVSAGTDIFMAAKSTIYVLGGDPATNTLPSNVPEYLARFLVECATPAGRRSDAWALHEELKRLMERFYGPKRYIQFTMPATA